MRLLRRHKDPQPVVEIRRMMFENGVLDVDLDPAPDIVAMLFATLAKLLHDAPNYVETAVTIKPAGVVEPFVVTVQRGGSPTPHQLRRRAEERVEELERELGHLVGAANHPDSDFFQACVKASKEVLRAAEVTA